MAMATASVFSPEWIFCEGGEFIPSFFSPLSLTGSIRHLTQAITLSLTPKEALKQQGTPHGSLVVWAV